MSFRDFLSESYYNYLPNNKDKKEKDAVVIHKMIHDAYVSQGGNKSPELATPESMVNEIPFWKVSKNGGTITAVALYIDGGKGRKRIAIASDGSEHGKKALGKIVSDDLKQERAHAEVSGKSLSFLKKQIDLKNYVHSFEDAKAYHASKDKTVTKPEDTDPEVVRHPELKNNFYVRMIAGHAHTKLMLGTLGTKIVDM
jgi:hypothetical protein